MQTKPTKRLKLFEKNENMKEDCLQKHSGSIQYKTTIYISSLLLYVFLMLLNKTKTIPPHLGIGMQETL